jgi:uncharacterized membrane protein YccC
VTVAEMRSPERPKWPALSYLARYEWQLAARPGRLRQAAPAVRRALALGSGVLIPLLIGVLAGQQVDGVYAALGALLAGIASFQGVTRTRLSAVTVAGLGAALSTFVGATVAAASPWGLIPVVVVWGYAAGLAVCLGPRWSAVAMLWPLALLIAVGTPLDPAHAAIRAGLVLAGTALQGVIVMLSWAARRGGHERAALAASYRHLAEYAEGIADGRVQAPTPTALPAVARLADPNPLLPRSTRRTFAQLLEHAERIRAALAAVSVHGAEDPAARHLAADAAQLLSATADALTGTSPTHSAHLSELAPVLPAVDSTWRWAADALIAQLHKVRESLAALESDAARGSVRRETRGPAASVPGNATPVRRDLRAHLTPTGETGRHALRLAVAAGLAETLVRVTGLYEGRWIVLTVFLVLKPDYTSTVSRGVHRALGTAAGALLAALIATLLHASPVGIALLAGLAVTAAYAVFEVDYLMYSVFLTTFVVLLLEMVGLRADATAAVRLMNTAIGAALALVAYAAWPTWHGRAAPQIFERLVEAHETYATALLHELDAPGETGTNRLRALQSSARRARTDAEAALARLAAEPPHPTFTPEAARSVVASAKRVAHAELSLHTLVTSPARPDADDAHRAQASALAQDTESALADLASAVSLHTP